MGFAGSFWVLVLSVVGGVASGNLSVATVYSRCDIARIPFEGNGFVGVAFSLGFILGPALGGWASTMDPLGSDARGVFVLNEFSAAVISWPSGSQLGWLASCFKETLPLKSGRPSMPQTAIFQIGKSNPPFAKHVSLSFT